MRGFGEVFVEALIGELWRRTFGVIATAVAGNRRQTFRAHVHALVWHSLRDTDEFLRVANADESFVQALRDCTGGRVLLGFGDERDCVRRAHGFRSVELLPAQSGELGYLRIARRSTGVGLGF